MMIWFLFLIAPGGHTSQLVQEPSREFCSQQAAEYNAWAVVRKTAANYDVGYAYCVTGMRPQ